MRVVLPKSMDAGSSAQDQGCTSVPHSTCLAMAVLAEEKEPVAYVGDPRSGGSGLLCPIPLHRAGKYNMLIFIFLAFTIT